MKVLLLVGISILGFSFEAISSAQEIIAQESVAKHSDLNTTNSLVPAKPVKSSAMKMGYRVEAWKTLHSSTSEEAEQSISTLEKIGCEVKSRKHDNHIDVIYRCVNWRSMKLSNSQLVEQWSSWCKDRGMETVLLNPSSETKLPTVRFRMATSVPHERRNDLRANHFDRTIDLLQMRFVFSLHLLD